MLDLYNLLMSTKIAAEMLKKLRGSNVEWTFPQTNPQACCSSVHLMNWMALKKKCQMTISRFSVTRPLAQTHVVCISTFESFLTLPHEAYRQNNKKLHLKKKRHGIYSQRIFSSWNKGRVFSSHCCCNAPLLPRWQGRVDCMLWYALSRNLWMCRSIIAILYLIGHFSFRHSSPPLVKSNVI